MRKKRLFSQIAYPNVITVANVPEEALVKAEDFVLVRFKEQNYWAMFRCPCGCQELISLPLGKHKYPKWWFELDSKGRPNLYPSVWRTVGCESHFWISHGRVLWAGSWQRRSKK